MSTSITLGNAQNSLQVGQSFAPISAEIHLPPERIETPPPPLSTVPLLRDPDFVQRQELLQQIDKKVRVAGARVAVVGLGGTGKTQLAVEYAAQVRSRSPDTWVIWISANTAARVQQSAKAVAERLKIRGRNDPRANVLELLRRWLSDGRKGRWLTVLDNLDDADILAASEAGGDGKGTRLIDYFPVCEHGSVIVTTRTRNVARLLVHASHVVDVPPMDAEHASVLLEKKLGSEERQDHQRLAEALDFLPLALSQAAAYICAKRPRSSIAHYLHEVEESRQSRTSLLQRGVPLPDREWEASSSVIATWQISFEHIYQTQRSAADLLSFMSLCDRQAIPETLVRAVKADDESRGIDEAFEDDIAMLRSFSFISTTTSSTDWTMHRLVQDATRVWIAFRGRFQMAQERFIRGLSAVLPTGDYENWKTCQVLLPHVQCAMEDKPTEDVILLKWASIMYRAAWYSQLVGDWDQARSMADKSVQVRAEQLGREDAQTMDSQAMLADVLRAKGQWAEAEELEVEVMDTRKAKLGADHPKTLTSMANLASTYWNQGRWMEAEALQITAVEGYKTSCGPQHPDTITAVSRLASMQGMQRRSRWKWIRKLGDRIRR